MDIVGAIAAAYAFFVAHWVEIEGIARNLAADLTALWVLGLALAKILKPFFPSLGLALEAKVLGVFKR